MGTDIEVSCQAEEGDVSGFVGHGSPEATDGSWTTRRAAVVVQL